MTELISRELYQVFIMFYCGLAVMIVFTVRDSLIGLYGKNRRLKAVIYLGFWLCAAFLFCRFLYRGSHGVLSVYGILSFGAGILLWKKGICGILFHGILSERQQDRDVNGVETHEKQTEKRTGKEF